MKLEYKKIKEYGIISGDPDGWKKVLTLESWNGNSPKYGIRNFSPQGEHLKGLTLTREEVLKLREILDALDI